MTVAVEPLSGDSFAPYGEVVAHGGETGRWFIAGAFAPSGAAAPALWVNRLGVTAGNNVAVMNLERHPFSAQSFLPLQGGRLLVVVCGSAASGDPDPATLRAFETNGHQGITYRAGIWHHGLLALDRAAEVAVIMGFTGRDDDTDIHALAAPLCIRLPAS